jgi:hypothetical protein
LAGTFRKLAFYKFCVCVEGYVVAQKPGEFGVADIEIRAFDRSSDLEAGDGLFVHGVDGSAVERGREGNGFGYAMEGQVACNRVGLVTGFCERRAFEAERPELGGVKEIGALEVGIALFVAGVDRGHICGELDGSIGAIILGRSERGTYSAKVAGDGVDTHVGDTEHDLGVCLVHIPLGEGGCCDKQESCCADNELLHFFGFLF